MGMLVLGRLVGERIIIKIGDKEFSIMLAEAWAGGCRLGFEAPRDVVIMREELLQSKDKPS